jgi:cytochrome o ubiquinol oxidase subunit 2
VQSIWQSGVLDPHGPVGAAERLIMINATIIMLAVILPVMALALGFAWWFRAGNSKARYLPNFEYSGPIELIVWSIPALVVTFLGGMAWIGSHDLDPPKALPSQSPPLEIQVVALDWKWLFIYPAEGVAAVNQLAVPTGTRLRFTITSSGVMNSFFIPQLGSQIYAMAGMATQLELQADRPGRFRGLSSQFSGDGFSDMHFPVTAMPAAEFQEWIGKAKQGGGQLDAAAYARLVKPSTADKPATFGAVERNLFQNAMHTAVK